MRVTLGSLTTHHKVITMNHTAATVPAPTFQAKRVQDDHRAGFMPRMFPGFYLQVELRLFGLAEKCIPQESYSGYFDFFKVTTRNGEKPAPLFMLSGEGEIDFTNLFDSTYPVSVRCASCILTSLVLVTLVEKCTKALSDDTREQLVDWYYTIMDAGRKYAQIDGCSREYFLLTD